MVVDDKIYRGVRESVGGIVVIAESKLSRRGSLEELRRFGGEDLRVLNTMRLIADNVAYYALSQLQGKRGKLRELKFQFEVRVV